jgi:hypothetical protein
MDPRIERGLLATRRHFLRDCHIGIGAMALAGLAGGQCSSGTAALPAQGPFAPRRPHFPPKARRVIFLHMAGSPPHLDLLDYKPELVRLNGQPCPESFHKGKRFAFTTGTPTLLGFDHRRLTYPHLGRDFRLTDVAGQVVEEILA